MNSIDKFLRDWWRGAEKELNRKWRYTLRDVNKQYLDDCFEVSMTPQQAVQAMAEHYEFHKLKGRKPRR
jgi:hypothetical protein